MIKFNAKQLAAVALAQSTEETRYYLCGVFFKDNIAVATDGHILTKAVDTENDNAGDGVIYSISKKAITAMKKDKSGLATIEDGVLKVFGEHTESDEILHMEPVKEIDGAFPDYERVIPYDDSDQNAMVGGFDNQLLKRICDTAAILSKSCPVTFTGADASSPHRVKYHQDLDVMSVIMPMRV